MDSYLVVLLAFDKSPIAVYLSGRKKKKESITLSFDTWRFF